MIISEECAAECSDFDFRSSLGAIDDALADALEKVTLTAYVLLRDVYFVLLETSQDD